ncbi:MAG: alpha/beta hydrolase [Thermoanaerobaculales bacterium]|nr:alpha/beta hydrolase [Thermoanaerobaculales bacterium]
MNEKVATLSHMSDGAGDPLVLLNGIAMTAVSWEVVARPLAEHYRVVRCDFRGQLMTPAPPPENVAEHADDVAALLDQLGIDSAHIIGTSFGGVVGTLMAARHPDRVRSLTTIASADGFDELMAGEVVRWRTACVASLESADRGHLSDILEPVVYSPAWVEKHKAERAQRRAQISALPDQWFEGLIGLLDSAHSLRLREELERVRCPTLVIAAELDSFVPLGRARGLAEAIDGASFRIIEGAGHAVVVEQPKRVIELCLEFLKLQDGIGRPPV